MAAHLVAEAGATVVDDAETGVLVVGNGSAKRTEKAPGHLDERAEAFDAAVGAALLAPDPAALAALDERLAAELWADVAALRELGGLLRGGGGRGGGLRRGAPRRAVLGRPLVGRLTRSAH
ncbi:hypothetical protein [Nocardioides sp. TF02-7]|uniref:hypothetical protein n=1 Tax=Nocardioides sp. TF02-7 TaxID=2917724 RepID=UPI001F064AA3|nr:hypothetical protein [Nocardioides sp. TF02-7]UMG91169.1 hypothetical protein MF408_13295 [Nocardioides sp. TF02-7]